MVLFTNISKFTISRFVISRFECNNMPPMDLLTPKMWTPLYYENGFCIGRTHLLLWKKVLMRHRWVESPSSLQLPARMDDPQGTWKRLCHFSPGKTNKKKTSLTHISWDILKTKKCGKNITPGPTALSAPSATDSLWYINQR